VCLVALASLQTASADPVDLAIRRPFEGELAAMTLWPETEKIFGHGYEVMMTYAPSLYRGGNNHQRT
jgi:hypothetical protein